MMPAVLFTSAGRRVSLMKCFRDSARKLGLDLSFLAADASPQFSSACQLADQAFPVSRADHPNYADDVLEICRKHDVRLVIPTIDTELAPLVNARAKFETLGVKVHVGDSKSVSIARDKSSTANRLSNAGLAVPKEYSREQVLDGTATLPLIAKPRDGSSSQGIYRLTSAADFGAVPADRNYMFQELLKGDEYTVGVFVDNKGQFRCAVPHLRIEVRGGEVSKGLTVRDTEFTILARGVSAALPGLRGAFCFQAIKGQNGACVFEINARFGGGYPLAHAAGATFSKWLLEECFDRPCTAHDNWRDGVTMLRYDSEVFI